jgi:cytochrome P450
MKDRQSGTDAGERQVDPRVEEILAELRADLEENPNILDEFLEGMKELNRILARTVQGLEESNRRGEQNRREIDALKAELHAQAG